MDQIVPQTAHQQRAVRISLLEITQNNGHQWSGFVARELICSHISNLNYRTPVPLLHSGTFMTAICGDFRMPCLIIQVLLRPVVLVRI